MSTQRDVSAACSCLGHALHLSNIQSASDQTTINVMPSSHVFGGRCCTPTSHEQANKDAQMSGVYLSSRQLSVRPYMREFMSAHSDPSCKYMHAGCLQCCCGQKCRAALILLTTAFSSSTPQALTSTAVARTLQEGSPGGPHSFWVRVKPRLRFFMAAREPAMVSRIFSPAAAALERAAAVLPPNLRKDR